VLCICLLSAPRTTLLQHCPQNNSQAHWSPPKCMFSL
jgi:hypothetical protein